MAVLQFCPRPGPCLLLKYLVCHDTQSQNREPQPEMTMTPLDFCSDFCKSFLCVSVAFSSSAKATNLPPSEQGRASMTTKQKQTNTKTTEQHKQRRQRQHLLQVGEGVASGKGGELHPRAGFNSSIESSRSLRCCRCCCCFLILP